MEFETPTFAKKGNASLHMNWNLQYWERHRFSYVQKSTGGGTCCESIFIPLFSETKGCTVFERVLLGEFENRQQVAKNG
jgi:hypothetical protein